MHRHNSLIQGTLILTICGLFTRFMGFFYRIFLSRVIGSSGMGLYQLIIPFVMIAYSFCSMGVYTALSKTIAVLAKNASREQHKKQIGSCLFSGILLSVIPGILVAIFIYQTSPLIATHLLKTPAACQMLQIMSFTIPLHCLHSCIDGCMIGLKDAKKPGLAVMVEQFSRILCVFLLWIFYFQKQSQITPLVAVFGALAGDICATVFMVWMLVSDQRISLPSCGRKNKCYSASLPYIKELFSLSLPVSLNRMMLSCLQSCETMLIPYMLVRSGLTSSQALSIFGIFSGMALAFILFPTTFVQSLATMLLPEIAGYHAGSQMQSMKIVTEKSLCFSLTLGLSFMGLFATFGSTFGALVFAHEEVAYFIRALSILCPFLYISGTCQSILHGLGDTTYPLIINVISTALKICSILFLIPFFQMNGFIAGLTLSSILEMCLYLKRIRKNIKFHFSIYQWLLRPGLITMFALYATSAVQIIFRNLLKIRLLTIIPAYIPVGFLCGFYLLISMGFTWLSWKTDTPFVK